MRWGGTENDSNQKGESAVRGHQRLSGAGCGSMSPLKLPDRTGAVADLETILVKWLHTAVGLRLRGTWINGLIPSHIAQNVRCLFLMMKLPHGLFLYSKPGIVIPEKGEGHPRKQG
ncbi:hypothetical protein ABT88_12045 [Salmonella enterica subsp. enterica serovar Typhimurium]|nr:hypothetical protein ABT88_12045 [Salmonella enterica subsp. enterica serovar Typhimurium]